ncbi:hypothetical protein U1Q18_039336, partial [Sarracenia purpurea var. burkii]
KEVVVGVGMEERGHQRGLYRVAIGLGSRRQRLRETGSQEDCGRLRNRVSVVGVFGAQTRGLGSGM